MDAFSIATRSRCSTACRWRRSSKFTNMRFEPAGMTDDPDIRMAQSMMDYVFRRLALDYLPYEKRSALGIFTADERRPGARGSRHADVVTPDGGCRTARDRG
jgi:ribonucleoside-diphosphate reductase alpha chain